MKAGKSSSGAPRKNAGRNSYNTSVVFFGVVEMSPWNHHKLVIWKPSPIIPFKMCDGVKIRSTCPTAHSLKRPWHHLRGHTPRCSSQSFCPNLMCFFAWKVVEFPENLLVPESESNIFSIWFISFKADARIILHNSTIPHSQYHQYSILCAYLHMPAGFKSIRRTGTKIARKKPGYWHQS